MVDRNAQIPDDRRLIFRMGINLGDIIGDGDDIYGDGVNIAARLEALAEPGGICVSRVVRDQIRDKLPHPFADMGEQSVKNIVRPVRSYAMSAAAVATTAPAAEMEPGVPRPRSGRVRTIIAAGSLGAIAIGMAAWWAMPNRNSPNLSAEAPAAAGPRSPAAVAGAPLRRLSIVVLPFVNLSNNPDQEYFADAITDDLTTDLSRISGSFVIAPTTLSRTKAKGWARCKSGMNSGSVTCSMAACNARATTCRSMFN
jgi:adenylate cyclase